MKRVIILVAFVFCLELFGCSQSAVSIEWDFENSSMDLNTQKNYTEALLKFMDELNKCGGDISKDEYLVCVDDETITMCQSNVIYVNTGEINSPYTFLKIFFALSENDKNAGEAYGFVAQLCKKSGIAEVEEVYSDEELAEFFSNEENLYLLDFTLPMLESYFFDEEITEYAKAASVSFVEYCIEEYGMKNAYKLCMDASEKGHATLVELKNDWLDEIGVLLTYEELGKIPFSYNYMKEVAEYPYIIVNESANWYFSLEDVKEYGYNTFVTEYSKTASIAEADFAEARELLEEYILDAVPVVDIYTQFYKADGVVAGAQYYSEIESIYAYIDWNALRYNLLHEYIHHLTIGKNKLFEKSSGLVEGITDEIAFFECENQLERAYYEACLNDEVYGEDNYAYMKEIGAFDQENNQVNADIYYHYNAKLYYELEPSGGKYQGICGYRISKPKTVTMYTLSYKEAGSLAKYLVEQYGLEAVLKNCASEEQLQKLTKKTFFELYDDWGIWNEQRYQELKTM